MLASPFSTSCFKYFFLFVYDASNFGSTNRQWFVEPKHVALVTNFRVAFDCNSSFVSNINIIQRDESE